MAEIEKEAWERIKSREQTIDPGDSSALAEACQNNRWLDVSELNLMALATEDDLAYVLHGGGWSRGTGYVYKDLAFVEQNRDEWAAFTRVADGTWEQFDSMSFALESQAPDEVARIIAALAISVPEERREGGWHELADALDGENDFHWEHSSSMELAWDGTFKPCRSLHAETGGLTIAVYERPSYPGWAVDMNEGPMGSMRRVNRTVDVESLAEALSLADRQASEYARRAAQPAWNHRSDYMLLDRLKMDCDYYLGYGNRAEKYLWAGDAESQISKMRELYAVLPEKPEWLTAEQIDEYEQRMAPSPEVRDREAAEARFSTSDVIAAESPLETSLVSVSCDRGCVTVELEQWDRMRTDMQDVSRATGVEDPGTHTMGQWAERGEAARAALKASERSREGARKGTPSKSPAAAKSNAESAAAARSGQGRSTERANPTR